MYTFTSAEGYLASVNASEASCVVIDLELRGAMSGLDLGKTISSPGNGISIIFMTGTPYTGIRKQALAVGCAAFLEKPFPGELLVTAIRGAGGRSCLHRSCA